MKNKFLERPLVLLSIVTWNHEKTIRQTLDSIFNQSYINFQVVVFDNNSTDGTVSIVESFLCNKNISLIKNKENVGFCGGHNYVIGNFTYDYLFLVNPDIILTSSYVENTLKTFSLDKKIGAVCGLLVQSFEDNPLIDSTGMKLLKSRRFSLINNGERLRSVQLQSGYVAGLDGALPAFRKDAIDSILINGNLFNNLFFAHKEDWDVSWRLILSGWKTYFNKESIAVHPRYFKPNNIKYRLSINNKIKYDAFKNQFLLLLINEDFQNFRKDFFAIVPRLIASSFFCLFFERKSLKAFSFLFRNRKQIRKDRLQVQGKRQITSNLFRDYVDWQGI